jgi:hypothetical protein
MKKIIALCLLALAVPAFAIDADTAWRESVRTTGVTQLFTAAVSFPGNITVATNATIAGAAIVNLIDTTGAADIDVGSADVTDVTVTTDGGTVILDGVVTASDDVTCDKIIFTDMAVAAPTNALTKGFLVPVGGTNYWIALYPVND